MLKHQEERRKKRNFIIQKPTKFEENHRTQELDASKLWIIKHNTTYIFHWKAKDPTSSDEKKEDQELYNELFQQSNRRHPRPSRSFHAHKVLAPSPTRNPQPQKPQHTEHYEEETVSMHNFKNLKVNRVTTHALFRRRNSTCEHSELRTKSE